MKKLRLWHLLAAWIATGIGSGLFGYSSGHEDAYAEHAPRWMFVGDCGTWSPTDRLEIRVAQLQEENERLQKLVDKPNEPLAVWLYSPFGVSGSWSGYSKQETCDEFEECLAIEKWHERKGGSCTWTLKKIVRSPGR